MMSDSSEQHDVEDAISKQQRANILLDPSVKQREEHIISTRLVGTAECERGAQLDRRTKFRNYWI